jgi:hypothetical protein
MSVQAKWLIGSLLLMQALFLGSTFQTWRPVCLITIIASGVVVIRNRRPLQAEQSQPRAPRWLVPTLLTLSFLGIIGVTAVWRIANQVGESINPIYVGIDILTHAALFSSLLVWTIRFEHGHVSMLCLGLLIVLFCIAAGGASQSIAAQSTIALAACVGFALASQAILGSAPDQDDAVVIPESSIDGRPPRLGLLFSMTTLSILLMATSLIANASSLVLPGIRDSLQKQLQASFDSVGEQLYIGGTRYVRGSQLGSIRKHMLGDPQEVALRVFSDYTPGYLRGHAFDLYRSRRWLSATRAVRNHPASVRDRAVLPARQGTAALREPGNRSLRRFDLVSASGGQIVNLEIHNDPLKGPLVFLPLTTRWVEARSNQLVMTHHGTVSHGVDSTSPYVAGVATTGIEESLNGDRRELLLRVPPELSDETTRIAGEVCGTLRATRSKALAVSRFFQTEFSYSLTPTKPPRRIDPLLHFLQTKHAAHCEYFASATVLVLRSAGVPTRYVTGYVADEFDLDESSWVARNSDAHAWAEAYDDTTRTWIPVESTPGRTYQTVDPNAVLDQTGSLFDVFGIDDGDDSDSIVGRAIGWLLSIRATEPLMIIFRIAQLPLFCVLAFLLWSKYLKPSKHVADTIDQRSRRMLNRVDRRIRKYSLVRMPGETLYQFANRIDESQAHQLASDQTRERLDGLSLWYRDYANARYRGRMPTPYAS